MGRAEWKKRCKLLLLTAVMLLCTMLTGAAKGEGGNGTSAAAGVVQACDIQIITYYGD